MSEGAFAMTVAELRAALEQYDGTEFVTIELPDGDYYLGGVERGSVPMPQLRFFVGEQF